MMPRPKSRRHRRHFARALPGLAVLASAILEGTGVAAADADGRLYQWRAPASGRDYLSGVAPPWYRDGSEGPRVRVYEDGLLVDDTDIPVPEATRSALRAQALGRAEPTAEMRAGTSSDTAAPVAPAAAAGADVTGGTDTPVSAAAMRERLEDWDRIRAREARSVVHGADGSAGSADGESHPKSAE